MLPKRPAQVLKHTLRKLEEEAAYPAHGAASDSLDRDFKKKSREKKLETRIQEAFLRFMAAILKGYHEYLIPMSKAPTAGATDPNALFRLDAFLRSRDKAHHKFYNLLMKTQMFIRFIEERSFISEGYQGLAFFDECCVKVSTFDDGDDEIHFIDWDTAHNSDRTKYILPPDVPDETKKMTYNTFVLNAALLKRSKSHVARLLINSSPSTPGSPMARRTKYEVKMSQKQALKCHDTSPELWTRHLLSTCYSIYFLILPSFLLKSPSIVNEVIKSSYDVLSKAHSLRIVCDEICYRVMMQLCGLHNQPILAVRLYYLMKRSGIQPNAVTYGFYNRCVLESQWPSDIGTESKKRWKRLRNVIFGVAQFKRVGNRSDAHGTDTGDSSTNSRDQLNILPSETNYFDFFAFDKLRDRLTNLVQNTDKRKAGAIRLSSHSVDDLTANVHDIDETRTNLKDFREKSNSVDGEIENIANAQIASTTTVGEANANETPKDIKSTDSESQTTAENVDNDGQSMSPKRVPPRTLVTENDPLGAFDDDKENQTTILQSKRNASEPHVIARNDSMFSDQPILFKGQRSATFDESMNASKQRSRTLPSTSASVNFAGIGSSFKFNFSPIINSKKSMQLLQGGISSIKSVATSVAKKIDEMKDVISPDAAFRSNEQLATTHQSNEIVSPQALGSRRSEPDLWGHSTDSSYNNLIFLGEHLAKNFPHTNQVKCTQITLTKNNEIEIEMSTSTPYHNCKKTMTDKDIMIGWSAEDSNLNTYCDECKKYTVPVLTINVTTQKTENVQHSYPYLNPLVLRKELENILAQNGENCLCQSSFFDEHPIIYWNLLWFMHRIGVETHLSDLYFDKMVSN